MERRRAVREIQRTQRLIARAMEDEKQGERVTRPLSPRREEATPRPQTMPPVPAPRAG